MRSGPTRRTTSLAARGEPGVWLLGAGLITSAGMIAGLLALIFYQGFLTFWPKELVLVTLKTGDTFLGEVSREDLYRPEIEGGSESAAVTVSLDGYVNRQLIRTGNYDIYGEDFKWVPVPAVASVDRPSDAVTVERMEWGPFFGFLEEFRIDGAAVAKGREPAWARFLTEHGPALELRRRIARLEEDEIGGINRAMDSGRLTLRRMELEEGKDSPEYAALAARTEKDEAELQARFASLSEEARRLKEEDARRTVVLTEVGGKEKVIRASEIVRTFQPNRLSFLEKTQVYLSRWWEFLTDRPREANTEGGIFPALFGTVLMTMLMALAVAPLGVLAALYLREYARQGFLVSTVRIAVNNLAGVPSIVFGIFGLGFFCYIVGGGIDRLFFPERLPSPTFGTGGLIWASITLALMTAPVVIVATEEALAGVPRSMREGAYACGASKWQTLHRVVLPRALPGILTGIILAMARGASEVAPLMITGVVKLAHDLPIDGTFPYLHLNRSFMHLGFHIYDVGFQSRNAEAGKPMVFTTTLLLILVVLTMNLSVIGLRARLRRKHVAGHF